MKRLVLLSLLVFSSACPRDKQPEPAKPPVDTPKTDLSAIPSNVPSAAPDTFKQQKLTPSGDVGAPSLPDAPPALYDAVQREQGFSRFCFTEFGKKADPTLSGNVLVAVTVGASGVSDTRVAASRWSGSAGSAVNRCLEQRARTAWKLTPGVVKPGKYGVRLSFTGA